MYWKPCHHLFGDHNRFVSYNYICDVKGAHSYHRMITACDQGSQEWIDGLTFRTKMEVDG